MTEFVSDVKTIPYSDADVYRVLSDLNKLELLKDQLPVDTISDFMFDADSVSFRVDPIGNVKFVVVEREENKLVKLKSEAMPIDVFLWVQCVDFSHTAISVAPSAICCLAQYSTSFTKRQHFSTK